MIVKPNTMREFKHSLAKLQKNADPRTNNKCNSRTALLILPLHIQIIQECQYTPLTITSDPQHYLCNTNRPTFIFKQEGARPTTFDQQRAEGEGQHTKTTQATWGRWSLARSGHKEGQCYNPKISCPPQLHTPHNTLNSLPYLSQSMAMTNLSPQRCQ